MLGWLVDVSVRNRTAVLVLLAMLLGAGAWAASILPIDAMPDTSTVQVTVLTQASGLDPEQVEKTITIPVENALNGIPRAEQFRSTSRSGLSLVTVILEDGTDVWLARQLVLERLRGVELPPNALTPELAPVSTGLGEIYQFVVKSPIHSPMQLRTLLDWEIAPKLRGVPGVVEVNTMGGQLKQFQVIVDTQKLHAANLNLSQVTEALRAANMNVGGGYINRGEEAYTVRGSGMFTGPEDIANVPLQYAADGTPTLVKHVAKLDVAPALRYGVVTYNGEGEGVAGIVMMLLGSNSRDVVTAVAHRIDEVRAELPAGVTIETVYDRANFVNRTINTVLHNLGEGVLIVFFILWIFLGTIRGAVSVVLGIPAAMSIALLGMIVFGVTGDLMSLGAIDFGFLVDGPIIVLEALIAATAGESLLGMKRAERYRDVAQGVARPVGFAVAIIMLVYVPLLALEGTEGKMFRPMAITMACALAGGLVYSLFFFPAVAVTMVPPPTGHGPKWINSLTDKIGSMMPGAIQNRYILMASATISLFVAGWAFSQAGAEFVPRIFEGDAVVTIRRPPSISIEEAADLDVRSEQILMALPEVNAILGMCGRAEVATDPRGNDASDMIVALAPLEEWTVEPDLDVLSVVFKEKIESKIPGTFVSVSQPIEDRTNEMISGSRADVGIQIFGPDLDGLTDAANQVGKIVSKIRGTGDVRVERLLGLPTITAQVNRQKMATFGVKVEDAFSALSAAREGIKVGDVYEKERRFDLRLHSPASEPSLTGLGQLFVETSRGDSVPLRQVVDLTEEEGPTSIRREDRARSVRVDVNLRGRDLVSWVAEAKSEVDKALKISSEYHVVWGGQFANFERAQKRLALVVPAALGIIIAMLLWMFGNIRFAAGVFAIVPFSLIGGMLAMLARGLSFSLPAAVGFIALAGIAVLNGVVIAQGVKDRLQSGQPLLEAVIEGTSSVSRAVLTTAAVAALGFLPMALSNSAGSEVQRPLATAVIGGILLSAAFSLYLLPGILYTVLKGYKPELPEPVLEHDHVSFVSADPSVATAMAALKRATKKPAANASEHSVSKESASKSKEAHSPPDAQSDPQSEH